MSQRSESLLVRRFSSLRAVPWMSLGGFPTTVEAVPALAERAGVGAVWVKRDDRSGALYGGNKVRRLEWLFGEAVATGARGVWTAGSLGSNHVLATALYGRSLGLEVAIRHYRQPITSAVIAKCERLAAQGTTMRYGPILALPGAMLAARWRGRRARRPGHLHYLPGGGSSALGALGYVEAALELDEQIAAGELEEPGAIVVPVGSGGTLAGLVVGFALAGRAIPIVGVRVVDRIVVNRWNLDRLIRGAARLLTAHGLPTRILGLRGRYRIAHDQFGSGYGESTPAAEEAVALAAEADLALETTYSGKALAGLLASGSDWIGGTGRVLFWLTADSSAHDPVPAAPEVPLPSAYRRLFQGLKRPSEPEA